MNIAQMANDLQTVLFRRVDVTMRGEYGTTLRAQVTPKNNCALYQLCASGWELIFVVSNGGEVLMQRALFDCVRATIAAALRIEAVEEARRCGAMQPAKTQPVAVEATQPVKARCPHYREIRRCYAIAREAGLDVKADGAMRAAFGRFLGRVIESRAALHGRDWNLVGDAIQVRALVW